LIIIFNFFYLYLYFITFSVVDEEEEEEPKQCKEEEEESGEEITITDTDQTGGGAAAKSSSRPTASHRSCRSRNKGGSADDFADVDGISNDDETVAVAPPVASVVPAELESATAPALYHTGMYSQLLAGENQILGTLELQLDRLDEVDQIMACRDRLSKKRKRDDETSSLLRQLLARQKLQVVELEQIMARLDRLKKEKQPESKKRKRDDESGEEETSSLLGELLARQNYILANQQLQWDELEQIMARMKVVKKKQQAVVV
jgi:hypothetical protein